jgi:predicted nucleic acid-binding protein
LVLPKSVSRTASIARTLDITVYDATYLELAQDLDCQAVTSDKPFRDKVLAGVFDESSRIVLLRDYSANIKEGRTKQLES